MSSTVHLLDCSDGGSGVGETDRRRLRNVGRRPAGNLVGEVLHLEVGGGSLGGVVDEQVLDFPSRQRLNEIIREATAASACSVGVFLRLVGGGGGVWSRGRGDTDAGEEETGVVLGEMVVGVDCGITVSADDCSVLLAKDEGFLVLADVTERRRRRRRRGEERETVVFDGEFVSAVDVAVTGGAECCFIGAAEECGWFMVAHITLYLHPSLFLSAFHFHFALLCFAF